MKMEVLDMVEQMLFVESHPITHSFRMTRLRSRPIIPIIPIFLRAVL